MTPEQEIRALKQQMRELSRKLNVATRPHNTQPRQFDVRAKSAENVEYSDLGNKGVAIFDDPDGDQGIVVRSGNKIMKLNATVVRE